MSLQELSYIRKTIRSDSRLLRLDDAFNTLPEFSLNTVELYEEINRIHMVRKTRHLNRKSASFTQDIIDGLLDDQAHRSRLSEIMMGCVHVARNLSGTLETMEGHLLSEYSDLLSSIRTKTERQTFVRANVLNKYMKYVDRVDRVKVAAETVIIDIDKAGYMYRNLIEAVKMSAGRKEAL